MSGRSADAAPDEVRTRPLSRLRSCSKACRGCVLDGTLLSQLKPHACQCDLLISGPVCRSTALTLAIRGLSSGHVPALLLTGHRMPGPTAMHRDAVHCTVSEARSAIAVHGRAGVGVLQSHWRGERPARTVPPARRVSAWPRPRRAAAAAGAHHRPHQLALWRPRGPAAHVRAAARHRPRPGARTLPRCVPSGHHGWHAACARVHRRDEAAWRPRRCWI